MDALKFLVIAVAACLIGFGLPVFIFLLVTQGSGMREIQAIQKMANAPRAIKSRDRDLQELSERVAELKAAERNRAQQAGGEPDEPQV